MNQSLTWNEALSRMRSNHKKMICSFMAPGDYWTCDNESRIINSNGAIISETNDSLVLFGQWYELISQEQFNLMNKLKAQSLGCGNTLVIDLGDETTEEGRTRLKDNLLEAYKEENSRLKDQLKLLTLKLEQLNEKEDKQNGHQGRFKGIGKERS